VGKTSLVLRLAGVRFNRKTGHKPTLGPEAVCTTLWCDTSSGLIAFSLYDLAWSEVRRSTDISSELKKAKDGALYVIDVTDKTTLRDWHEYNEQWTRASGQFDLPVLFVSGKSDVKKRAVLENEGPALAKHRLKAAHVHLSLADDTGVDELVSSLVRLMTGDANAEVKSFGPAGSLDPCYRS